MRTVVCLFYCLLLGVVGVIWFVVNSVVYSRSLTCGFVVLIVLWLC